ncbi:hypothetical protein B6F84_02710 [Acidianus manzaensis]|uniref:Uncharacterized protein n=2 Tax=Acidianus manzaensis TaxID=282676 RepID=A0A1W6JXS5_9CREN|nr:hypothetical protein B6F84_02710 [Acidianus manzaensis]
MATVVLGLVAVGLFASYGSITYANTVSLQQAQDYSAGLRISLGKAEEGTIPVVIQDYDYNGSIYLVAFYSKYNNPNYFTSQYAEINSTSPLSGNAKIYNLNNGILYEGQINYYKTYTGDLQLVSVKPGYYTILWIIIGNYEVGYEVIQ